MASIETGEIVSVNPGPFARHLRAENTRPKTHGMTSRGCGQVVSPGARL